VLSQNKSSLFGEVSNTEILKALKNELRKSTHLISGKENILVPATSELLLVSEAAQRKRTKTPTTLFVTVGDNG
jgi:hypothetical protein